MYDPPGYLWAITIAGIIAIPAATCVVLYGGAVRGGLGRTRAALLAGGAAVVLGGWFTASAVIAGHGWYHARLGHGVPWMPVAVAGFFGALLALRRIPVVARALAAPGMVARLELPHSFRAAEGTAFLAIMALGHLPALFALPDPAMWFAQYETVQSARSEVMKESPVSMNGVKSRSSKYHRPRSPYAVRPQAEVEYPLLS